MKRPQGFTLIETVATMAIISIVAVGLVSLSDFLLNKHQTETTTYNLNQLRRAIGGNPVIVVNEARTSFGYLGDMGRLPANLQDLWAKGSQPAFSFNSTKKAGAGWNGPYLEVGPAELASALAQDGWGNALNFNPNTHNDPVFGATVFAKLSSLGPDLALGTGDDIAINFFKADVLSRVQGYVKDISGNAVSGVGITLNYPDNGQLEEQQTYTDSAGYYFIDDVPFGNRSLTVQPKIVLAPGTVQISGPANQDLKFTVKNFDASEHNVASLTLAYEISPISRFEAVKVGGTTIYNSTNPRFGVTGSDPTRPNLIVGTANISPAKTIKKGPGVSLESIPIRLQSAVTDVADLVVGKLGNGGTLVIEFTDFYDEETPGDMDVSGVNFEITLKNSANQVVGVIAVTP
jgi:prepilin-type N-terminal cleavage/methylation domain-containing protein